MAARSVVEEATAPVVLRGATPPGRGAGSRTKRTHRARRVARRNTPGPRRPSPVQAISGGESRRPRARSGERLSLGEGVDRHGEVHAQEAEIIATSKRGEVGLVEDPGQVVESRRDRPLECP